MLHHEGEPDMKSIARICVFGLIGLVIFISACSRDDVYSKNFTAKNDAPIGGYDLAKYEDGIFRCEGWSSDKEDGAPIKMVLIYIDGKAVGRAQLSIDRPDVVSFFNQSSFLKSGWQLSAKVPLNKGPHRSMALIYDSKDALAVVTKDFIVK